MALVMPGSIRERLGVIPLRIAGARILYLGFAGRVDAAAALAVERMTGLQVECGLLSDADAAECQEGLRAAVPVECAVERVAHVDVLAERMLAALGAAQPVEAKVVRIGQDLWMRMWLEPAAMAAEGSGQASAEDVVDRVYRLDGRDGLL